MRERSTGEQRFALRPVDAALSRLGTVKSRRLLYALCAGIVILLLWAAWAEVDEVARAMGQIVPSQRVQVIQHLEGGILREVLAHEGQLVNKGDVLLRLDNESADSRLRDGKTRVLELKASMARLEGRFSGTAAVWPEEVSADQALLNRHKSLLDSERRIDAAELAVLETQQRLRVEEMQEQEERQTQMQKSLVLATRQRDAVVSLVRNKAYSEVEFMNLEQKVQSLAGELATLVRTIPRMRTAAEEAANRLDMHKSEKERSLRAEIHQMGAELSSITEELSAVRDRVTRMELRSPVRGIIKKVHMTTSGAVVRPGETIMDVVPLDDTLLVEARVNPMDIAFLYPGQAARVRLTAYDASLYAPLDATLEQISADTLEGTSGERFYQVKLRLHGSPINTQGKALPVLPGMMATVDILTGKKTVLAYILKPLLKARHEALRER